MATSIVLGRDTRIYRLADATTSPTVTDGKFTLSATEWTRLRQMGFNPGFGHQEDDVTMDGAVFAQSINTLNECNPQFTTPYIKGDTFISKLIAANFSGVAIPLIFLFGEITDVAVLGFAGYWSIATDMKSDMKTAVKIEVSCKPAFDSTVDPYIIGVS